MTEMRKEKCESNLKSLCQHILRLEPSIRGLSSPMPVNNGLEKAYKETEATTTTGDGLHTA